MSIAAVSAETGSRGWGRALAAWSVLVVILLVVLSRDALHIFDLWWNTDTYSHCILIPAILGWLVWQRRDALAQLTPKPFLPAAVVLVIGGLGWLVGELAGAAILRHTALVGMLIVSVPLVFGIAVARGLTFVLFYALFMIPAGDELVPILQQVTADICIKLLEWSGIPAFIDGVFIAIPNGNFEVAEACSGVRFLIAMTAFGVLVAHLCYKSWYRRIAFAASAIALSILANGFRAFGTIYIAHLTTPAFAAGVDHIIYGWIFFAIVMLILVAAGWRFFDRPLDDPWFDPKALQTKAPSASGVKGFAMATAIGVAASIYAPLYATSVLNREAEAVTVAIIPPNIAGWEKVAPEDGWKPHYKGASAEAVARYVDASGRPIDLYIAVFDRQDEDHELIGFQQGLLPPDSDWSWARNDPAPPQGRAQQINRGQTVREVWQYFEVNDKLTGNEYTAKIEALKARLFGGPMRAATLVISAPRQDGLVSERTHIEAFSTALGPVDAAIDRAIVLEQ